MPSKIIKGDKVIVLTGKDKGKTGEVTQVFTKSKKVPLPHPTSTNLDPLVNFVFINL